MTKGGAFDDPSMNQGSLSSREDTWTSSICLEPLEIWRDSNLESLPHRLLLPGLCFEFIGVLKGASLKIPVCHVSVYYVS